MIIGIGGISRSGKSFLAGELQKIFKNRGKSVKLLSQDVYVYPESDIPMLRDHVDWERPESIDFKRYIKAVKESASVNDITLVEGLMVFWEPALYCLFTCRIFIELGKKEFLRRKETDLRWGKEPAWYMEHIWKSFLIYGQVPPDIKTDIVLNGDNGFDLGAVFNNIMKQFS